VEVHANPDVDILFLASLTTKKMALVSRLQASVRPEPANDITRNLPSLQFDAALTEDEKQLLPLRARAHALAVTQCALATATVDVLKKAKYGESNSYSQIL